MESNDNTPTTPTTTTDAVDTNDAHKTDGGDARISRECASLMRSTHNSADASAAAPSSNTVSPEGLNIRSTLTTTTVDNELNISGYILPRPPGDLQAYDIDTIMLSLTTALPNTLLFVCTDEDNQTVMVDSNCAKPTPTKVHNIMRSLSGKNLKSDVKQVANSVIVYFLTEKVETDSEMSIREKRVSSPLNAP